MTDQQSKAETEHSRSGPMLVADDLSYSYGKVKAIRDVSLRIGEGDFVAVIGPNGAGKTTLADLITGFLPGYAGSLAYRGQEVSSRSPFALVEKGIAYCTEKRDLFGYMSVQDNLELGAYSRDIDVDQRLEFVYDLFPRLEEREEQYAQTMSGGEQQMLTIGRALMGQPDMLLLDEPSLGLAPIVLEEISKAIEDILETGMTILLFEQNITFALRYADYVNVLENGSIEHSGVPEKIQGDEYIREVYLGG